MALSLFLGACAMAPVPVGPEGTIPGARGVPGFDTRDYPGDATMRTWRAESPYRWVGYYLGGPCYRGPAWTGNRQSLRSMGWGLAVLFVGEQDWAEILPADRVVADPTAPRCVRDRVHGQQGREDAAAAARLASDDGFPAGTAIYLNVERVENISSDLRDYVREWTRAMLADGRYEPALYAHGHNAEALVALMASEFARAGRTGQPRLWVARTAGFDLLAAPQESGFGAAHIWQGILDARETWGGVTLRIDANVARSADPSAAAPR